MRRCLAGAFEATNIGTGLRTVDALISRTIPDGCIETVDMGANQLYIIGPDGAVLVQPNLVAMFRGFRHAAKRFNELGLEVAVKGILRGALRFIWVSIAAGVDAVVGLLTLAFVLQGYYTMS